MPLSLNARRRSSGCRRLTRGGADDAGA
jgi:hypothetical protein